MSFTRNHLISLPAASDPLLAARAGRAGRSRGGEGRIEVIAEEGERARVERVVDPSSVAAIDDEAGVPEGLEVEREAGLAGGEEVDEVADALLAAAEPFQDRQPGLVGEGVTQPRGRRAVEAGLRVAGGSNDGHAPNI